MAIFLAMAAIGCSTAQSPAPAPEPEPVAQAATPPPSAPVAEVEYDAKQLEFWVELTRRQYGKMFYSSRGYGEPPPARLIDGTEALARLRSQPRDLTLEDAWMELLARPGAKVVVLDFPDKPDVPTSVMVVPRPLSPVTDPPMPAPAFIIQFGMVDLPSETPDVPELAATLPDIPLASVEHARRRLAGGESFVILFSSQRCGAWKGFGERARHLYGAAGDAPCPAPPLAPGSPLLVADALAAAELERRRRFPDRLTRSGDAYIVERGDGATICAVPGSTRLTARTTRAAGRV